MVELVMYTTGNDSPTVTVRPIPEAGETVTLPNLSRKDVADHVSRRMSSFVDDGLNVAKTVAPLGARENQKPTKVAAPQRQRAPHDQQSHFELAYELMSQCNNDLVVRLLIVPVGETTRAQLAETRSSNNYRDLCAVGITVAGRQTHRATSVDVEAQKIAKQLTPSTPSSSDKAIRIFDRDPEQMVRRLVIPDPRPEPTGWPLVTAYVIKIANPRWNPIGTGVLGTLAKPVIRINDLGKLVGREPSL
jgi:hypothetical protein